MLTPPLATADGRRAWAFLAILGGCIVFTGFVAFAVWNLRTIAGFTFWLALAAHAQILVGLTAMGALFVRRTIRVGRDGIEISDAAEGAQTVADAAQGAADEIKAETQEGNAP